MFRHTYALKPPMYVRSPWKYLVDTAERCWDCDAEEGLLLNVAWKVGVGPGQLEPREQVEALP